MDRRAWLAGSLGLLAAAPRVQAQPGKALGSELQGKRLELLREVRPGLMRVAALWDLSPGSVDAGRRFLPEDAARRLGIALHPLAVREAKDSIPPSSPQPGRVPAPS